MGKGLGTGMLDKMVSGAFLGKRQLGRPLKYSFRTRGRAGKRRQRYSSGSKEKGIFKNVTKCRSNGKKYFSYNKEMFSDQNIG